MVENIEKILDFFEQVSRIPRCSKNEAKIRQWLENWAGERNWKTKRDNAGNLSVMVPATPGHEKAPIVVLQSHMDMVCEKETNSNHDFNRDPITLLAKGDWIQAQGTSLGADNGIGIALALMAASDDTFCRPPLQLLFTVEEETGLIGASAMSADLIEGRLLLNLDSEHEGVFIVGCAGGKDSRISIPVTPSKIIGKNQAFFTIEVHGLQGGHSGVDIHHQRANAIKILARSLMALAETGPIMLATINGGTAHNAIPRTASAEFASTSVKTGEFQKIVNTLENTVRREFEAVDSSVKIRIRGPKNETEIGNGLISHQETQKIIQLLCALPHGVVAMSKKIENLVETSCNLAVVNYKKRIIEIVTSQRSSVMSRLEEITDSIKAAALLAGSRITDENAYPAWETRMDSPILDRCKKVYQKLFKKEPFVDVIHAGLECAVIGAKYPEMDMISFGPTIQGAHSPDEKLYVPSLDHTWTFLKTLLESVAKESDS